MKDKKAVKGKVRVQIWLTPKTLKVIDRMAKKRCVSRSMCIEQGLF